MKKACLLGPKSKIKLLDSGDVQRRVPFEETEPIAFACSKTGLLPRNGLVTLSEKRGILLALGSARRLHIFIILNPTAHLG